MTDIIAQKTLFFVFVSLFPIAFYILLISISYMIQGSWNLEHAKLQARIEVLQKNERWVEADWS